MFLSFKGEDAHRSFTDHLYWTLILCNIRTFRDDEELPKRGEIKPELLQSFRIAVIMFPKTYAHSKWCLEELVKIINYKVEREKKGIPIFYHVDLSQVWNLKGVYEAITRKTHMREKRKDKKMENCHERSRKFGRNVHGT